jgi:hypothetical protein
LESINAAAKLAGPPSLVAVMAIVTDPPGIRTVVEFNVHHWSSESILGLPFIEIELI